MNGYTYYLSCNFENYFPETAKRVREYMQTRFGMPLGGCCHMEMENLKPGETVVTNCMSCTIMFNAAIENKGDDSIHEVNIIEILAEDEQFPWPDLKGEKITLQDCFRAKDKPSLQNAVRKCLQKMNAEIVELEENREECRFDGLFLYRNPSADSVKHAPGYFCEELPPYLHLMEQEEALEDIRKHIAQYTTERVVGYCNACVKGINTAGGNAVHLLELMFPAEKEAA